MSKQISITTIDNPFDPFDDFTSWLLFDNEKGYFTCAKLGRLANFTDDMTDLEEIKEIERVIDRLIELDPLDIYKKVTRET